MIFKKWKNIIGMHFSTKSYLKSTRNHTAKHALNFVTKKPLNKYFSATWISSPGLLQSNKLQKAPRLGRKCPIQASFIIFLDFIFNFKFYVIFFYLNILIY
jgi:hypothetical protein